MDDKKVFTQCGNVESNSKLTNNYWSLQYDNNLTQWDLGEVSPPIKEYINQLNNKNLRILIPGCGNTYEAEYLLQQGFTNITVLDYAPALVAKLKLKFINNPAIKIIEADFFKHTGSYDLVLEQTFFCAIEPVLRLSYLPKMKSILAPGGKIAGVLFGKEFDKVGPPFGGIKEQYVSLFQNEFFIKIMEPCYNSYSKRQGSELFIILEKR